MAKETKVEEAQDAKVTIPAGNTEAAMVQAQQEIDKAMEDATGQKGDITSNEAARANVLVEQSGYSFGGFAVSTEMSNEAPSLPAHPNDVKFNVTNPKDTGMQKGVTVVSKEVAEHFESLGLGKIVK